MMFACIGEGVMTASVYASFRASQTACGILFDQFQLFSSICNQVALCTLMIPIWRHGHAHAIHVYNKLMGC